MSFLDRFSPGQRQALMIGAPAVAGFVVVTRLLGGRKTPPAAGGPGTPSTNAIGVGQLTDFESHVTDQVNVLATLFAQMSAKQTAPPAPKPPPPPPPTHHESPIPMPPQHVVQLQQSSAPGVYFARVDPNTVVGVTPNGNFGYAGSQAQANVIVDTAPPVVDWPTPAPGQTAPSFDDPFVWTLAWP